MKLYELFEKIRSTNYLAEFILGLDEVYARCDYQHKDDDSTYELYDPFKKYYRKSNQKPQEQKRETQYVQMSIFDFLGEPA